MRRAWHQGEQETLAAIIEHRAAGLSWAKVADKLSATGHPAASVLAAPLLPCTALRESAAGRLTLFDTAASKGAD